MELLIAFAAAVLFVYSAKWRKFILITAAVVSVVVGGLCADAYYESHRQLAVDNGGKPWLRDPVASPDISDLPPPPSANELAATAPSKAAKDEYSGFADVPKPVKH